MSFANNRLVNNSLWMIFARFAAQGLAVIFTILLARRLGSADFGAYAFITTLIFIANAATTFGTDMLLIREIAAKDDLSGLPIALILQLVLSLVIIGMVWLFGGRIPHLSVETIAALKIYNLALIPLAFFTVFTIALRGKQLTNVYALLNIVLPLLQISAVTIFREKSLTHLSSLLLSVQILTALLAGLFCFFLIPCFSQVFHFSSFSPSSVISFLKATAPIAWLTLLGMMYQRMNIYLLATMSGTTETGIYSAAFRAVEASKTAHLAVFVALYPAMANEGTWRYSRSNLPTRESVALLGLVTSDTKTRFTRPSLVMPYLTLGAMLISLVLFILAKPLVILLYGDEFSASFKVLQILAWTLIPFTINTYLNLAFLVSSRERLVGRALMVSLLGLLILNLWWIPSKGPEGSAYAALVAEWIQSVILLAGVSSHILLKGETDELSHIS